MKRIGGNEFFSTLRGAKAAGSRRRLSDGARIYDTPKGFALLAVGEGSSERSYNMLHEAEVVARLFNGGKWIDSHSKPVT